jgi:replication factor C subunit 1
MYTFKYRPNKLDDFVGNKNVIQPFISWLLDWTPTNKKAKCALVSGVNGVGKSLLVELILKKHDYNIINLAIDDEKDKETMERTIKPLLKTKRTFDDQQNCLVFSDIDSNGGDYGFITNLTECIKESCIPIICICDDRYSQSIKPILNYCIDIKLGKPSYTDVYALIYKVVKSEDIKINKRNVDNLYEEANGDIRYILNTLQLGIKKGEPIDSKNIQSSNIFETTGQLLSQENNMEDKIRYYWMANDMHTLMVHENYINTTLNVKDDLKRLENISYSANSLSDADLIDSIFNFELSPYVAINTIKATSKCSKKGLIKFPAFLGKTSTINKNKKMKIDYEAKQLEDLNSLYISKNEAKTGKKVVTKAVKKTVTKKETKAAKKK